MRRAGRARSPLRPVVSGVVTAVVALSACGGTGPAADRGRDRGWRSDADRPPTITVAAAADLRLAFTEIGRALRAEGLRVRFTFGSSGLLAQQLRRGAPYDVFCAADVRRVDDVIAAGRGVAATKALYARGRLVLYTRPGLAPRRAVRDLTDEAVTRVAIANPAHAPYGAAAAEVIVAAGLRDRLGPRLVLGDHVGAALQLARTGNADVAIVARSLVGEADRGRWAPVPASRHRPIRHALVVTAPPGPRRRAAERFVAFVRAAPGQAILARHGFEPPGHSRAAPGAPG